MFVRSNAVQLIYTINNSNNSSRTDYSYEDEDSEQVRAGGRSNETL